MIKNKHSKKRYKIIPVKKLKPYRYWPREFVFDLVSVGLKKPENKTLIVRQYKDKYEIICGHRYFCYLYNKGKKFVLAEIRNDESMRNIELNIKIDIMQIFPKVLWREAIDAMVETRWIVEGRI